MEDKKRYDYDAGSTPDPKAVWLYSDGVYRWAYEKDLHRNRFEINYILKIVLLVFGLSWVLFAGMFLFMGMRDAGMALAITTAICLGGGLLTVGIVLLVQHLSANARGGVDLVCFEMDETGLRQILSDKAMAVDQKLERMTAISGMISGNMAVAMRSQQIVSGTHPNITSYADVRRVSVHPKYDVIDVTLKGNYKCRVYVRPEDFDFVRTYIESRAGRS